MGLSLSLAIIVAVLVHETIQRPKTQFNLGFFDTSPLPAAFSLREQLEEINVSSMGFAADNQRGSESFPKLRSQSGYNNQKEAAATLILNFYLLRIRRRPHRALKSPATTLGEI